MNNFEQFLGMGGKFIIKQQGEKEILVFEIEIDDKKYHRGIFLPDEIMTILKGDCSEIVMREVNKILENQRRRK